MASRITTLEPLKPNNEGKIGQVLRMGKDLPATQDEWTSVCLIQIEFVHCFEQLCVLCYHPVCRTTYHYPEYVFSCSD